MNILDILVAETHTIFFWACQATLNRDVAQADINDAVGAYMAGGEL